MKIIGKVSATQNSPTTADEFTFWLADNEVVGPFDLVAVQNDKSSITVGIVKDISHATDSASHIAGYVSHDFGQVDGEATTRRVGTVYVSAEVLSNDKEVYMPLRDGASVRFATEKEIQSALGMDAFSSRPGHTQIPAGFISMSNGTSVPVALDSAFLIGPEGAHVNISGISGLATKTSYAMFLLQSVAQKMTDGKTAVIVFNVKGNDLLYLDEAAPKSEKTNEKWTRCGLTPQPFQNVKYFFPFKNDSSRAHANTWCGQKTVLRRQAEQKAANYVYVFQHDKEKLDLLLSNIDDPNQTIDAIIHDIVNGGAFASTSDWEDLITRVAAQCESGQKNPQIPVASWRKFRRVLTPIVKRDTSSVFQDTLSLDTAKHQVHLDEEIEKIRPGDTYVIDIANIPEQEKCLVFGDVIRSVYRMKTEGSADCPDRIILFVDELNKYAPENVKQSPIISDLLEITERGRSLGVVLFAAEQFRSAIHARVKGNCGTNIYGRTNAVEIGTSDFRYIPKTYANMMTRLSKGNLIVSHPIFRTLLKIEFPMPAYRQPDASDKE